MENRTTNVHEQIFRITQKERQKQNGHKSFVLWFTGLSGSGKSTLSNEVELLLFKKSLATYILDGDNIRLGLNKDLGFLPAHRTENIRRIAEVSKLFIDAGVICITAFISPYRADRDLARSLFHIEEFIEVYVECPLEVCKNRDPKGLYKKALDGEIKDFTGVSSPYEPPLNPEITVQTNLTSVTKAANQIVEYLIVNKFIH